MEEETYSCSSTHSIKNYQVPDYMKKTSDDLSQVLLGIEEFQEKRKIIPYFAQYEFESQKQKMHSFWARSFEQVMKKHEKSCIISINYLHQIFNFNGFQPMSLQKVIDELVEENNFSLAGNKIKMMKMLNLDITQEVKEEEKRKQFEQKEMQKQHKKQGFLQRFNIFNYFKGGKDENQTNQEENINNIGLLQQLAEIQEQNGFIINKTLMVKHFTKFKEFLNKNEWYNDHFAFESDILQAAHKAGMNMGEVKLFLEMLEKDGQMKTFGDKELGKKIIFYDKDKKSQMNEDYFTNSSVLFQLEYNIQILEKNIHKYTEQLTELKKKYLECKETEQSKKNQFLREYLIIQKTINNMLNKKQTLKKNQLHVEDAITNKRVLNILNQGVATAKQNQVDTAVLEDIKEQLDEVNAQEQEIQDVFQQFNALNQQEQEAIDKEMQDLLQETGFLEVQSQNQNNAQLGNNFNKENMIIGNTNLKNNANMNVNNNQMDVEEDPQLKLLNELA